MLQLKNVRIAHGEKVLIKDISFDVHPKQIIAILGENGCGKSSLFAVISKEQEPADGRINLNNGTRIASLLQEVPALATKIIDFAIAGDRTLSALLAKLAQAEADGDYEAMAACHARMYEVDAYTAEARAAKILIGLGFSEDQFHHHVSTLSGGWRIRLALARCLFAPGDLLLLDEPTNHLDLEAIEWLGNYLVTFPGAILLVSHDQDFLDRTATDIAQIENQTLTIYKGNYSSFELQRAYAIALNNSRYKKQQSQIAHAMTYIDRFRYKATKARQAQSRLKAMERMELLQPIYETSPLQFRFQTPSKVANPMLSVQKASFGYDDHAVIGNVNFSLLAKQRICLLGLNGSGKSTFIKGLCGDLEPLAGTIVRSDDLTIGYFAQHQVDELPLDISPIALLKQDAADKPCKDLLAFLAGFGFDRDQAHNTMTSFSGGEKARIALARIIAKNPNLLLLDEPTNHLDLAMRRALEVALQHYEGSMILVSHDRKLIRNLVDDIFLIQAGKLIPFEGGIDDYSV